MKNEFDVDFVYKFDVKEIDQIFLVNKDTDPLTALYELLIVESNNVEALLNGKKPMVGSVVINEDLYKREVLDRILPKYAKKHHRNSYVTQKQMDLAIAMLDLDIGPRTSQIVPVNEIWLLKDWLV